MGDEADADWQEGLVEAGMEDMQRWIDEKMESVFRCPPRKQCQTAFRLRGRSFETVELDAAGKVIEPPPRCCYGTVLHAPNCKYWLTCT